MRELIALLALVFLTAVGCNGNVRGPVVLDAGREPTNVSLPSPAQPTVEPDDRAGRPDKPLIAMRRAAHAEARARAVRKAAPTDPEVLACVGRPYANWAALSECLHGAPPPVVPDAGAVHRYGAVRIPPVCAAQSVPQWYVDPTAGDDNNSCVTTGSPCKTYREITARWGCGGPPVTNPVHSSVVQVTFLDSQPNGTDRVIYEPILNNGGVGYVTGTWTMIATGTLSSVSARSLTAADPRLKADLGSGASGHLSGHGLMLVNTTRASSVAIVQEVIAGTQVAISQPFDSNAPSPPTLPAFSPAEHNDWANGDTWQLWQLPNVYLSKIGGLPFAQSDSAGVLVSHVNIPDESGSQASAVEISNSVQLSEDTTQALPVGNGPFADVLFTNVRNENGASLQLAIWVGGSIEFGGAILYGSVLDGDVIVQGTSGATAGIECTSPGESILSSVQMVGGVQIVAESPTGILPFDRTTGYGGGADAYGTYTLLTIPGTTVTYDFASTASLVFQGVPTIMLDSVGTGIALDVSHSPIHQFGGISITPANIDLAVASGGFGGIAYGYAGSVLAPSAPSVSPSSSPYFVAGSGISLSGCATPGSACTISSTVSGGVSSVTGTSPIVASPTTGAVGVSLASSGVTAGSYTNTNLTVDAHGLITAASNGSGFTAGGDLSGTSSSQTVSKLQGLTLPSPTTGMLADNGSGLLWLTCNGDVSCTFGSSFNTLTLQPSGVTATTYGSANAIPVITFDAKGRATSATTATPVIGSMLGYAANGVSALNGTTFVTIASFTATTPADGITHTYRVHGDFNVQNTNNAAWDVLCGIAQNNTTTLLSPSVQMLIETAASFTWYSAGSVTVTTTAAPNTSETFYTMCNLNTAGSTGISVNANVDALIVN